MTLHKAEAVEIGAVLKETSTLILPKEIWTDTSPIAQPGDKLWERLFKAGHYIAIQQQYRTKKTNNKAHFFPLG